MGEGTQDWSVLSCPGVEEALEKAAYAVASNPAYADYVEYDDLLQDARCIAAIRPHLVYECLDPESGFTLGVLKHCIEMDLIDKVKTFAKRHRKVASFEQRAERIAEDVQPVSIAQRESIAGYTTELVEALLPAVWDELYAYGMQAENAPDGDMPRSAPNKATGNTLAAHIADIRKAWKVAPLTMRERRVLYLYYALGWRQEEIAFNQEVDQSTVSRWLESGVHKMLQALGGQREVAA